MRSNIIILLVLAFAIGITSSAKAEDKITGAFGIKLGQVFNPSDSIGKGLTDGTSMYLFSPKKKFRS